MFTRSVSLTPLDWLRQFFCFFFDKFVFGTHVAPPSFEARLALFDQIFFSQPHISPRPRCPNRKISKKLLAICLTCHQFWFVFFPSCCSLTKLGQFWPFRPPPGHPKWYLTSKSSLQPSIHIFRKSKKNGNFSHLFFSGNHKSMIAPPPSHPLGLTIGARLI